MSILSALMQIRSILDQLIQREVRTMPSAFKNRVHIAVPVAVVPVISAFFVTALGRQPDEIGFSINASPDGQGEATHLLASEVFTDEEVEVIRPYVSSGGSGYLVGIRARRGVNLSTETTTNEAGKTPVTELVSGDTIPPDADWSTTRVSFPRFLEELSLQQQYPSILPPR